jgi:hypothetical protein
MKSWLALIVAPSIALAAQSIMYAMVTPSCSRQAESMIHLAAAVSLAIVLVLAVLAYGESTVRRGAPEYGESTVRRGAPASHDSDEAGGGATGRFLATMGTAVAALSALVIVGMWLGVWVLSPCELL